MWKEESQGKKLPNEFVIFGFTATGLAELALNIVASYGFKNWSNFSWLKKNSVSSGGSTQSAWGSHYQSQPWRTWEP